ncbi:hypothetical protein ACJW31_12G068400 [Castanea mollissima]
MRACVLQIQERRVCGFETSSNYTFVREATSAPAITYYDYIIIGEWTSRGGSPYSTPNITNIENFSDTLSDTSPTQQFTSEDGVYSVRACILGGGTALNVGLYSHASTRYVKEAGWDETLVNKFYEWVEKLVVFKPPKVEYQVAVRDGLLEAGVLPYNGFTYDHLYGTKIGGTIFDKRGHRHTAADLLKYADPRKITVYLHATVYKILFTYSRPQAYGVIFKDASAAAIGSPQLLMLSGVGPSDHLEAHGIKVVLDQPLVSQGMADNLMNLLVIPSPILVEVTLAQTVGITRFGSLPLLSLSLSLYLFTNQPFTVPKKAIAEAAEITNAIANNFKGGVIVEKSQVPSPQASYLELRITNLNDNPAVTFNYFKEPEDLMRCVLGMRTIIEVVNAYPFSKFRYSNMTVQALIDMIMSLQWNKWPRHPSAAFSLEQFCIDIVMTIWHFHGGFHVGKVVDRDYKVLGVDALRVINGSTFLRSPGTNPQATVMMLGRYMGEKISHERCSHGRNVVN